MGGRGAHPYAFTRGAEVRALLAESARKATYRRISAPIDDSVRVDRPLEFTCNRSFLARHRNCLGRFAMPYGRGLKPGVHQGHRPSPRGPGAWPDLGADLLELSPQRRRHRRQIIATGIPPSSQRLPRVARALSRRAPPVSIAFPRQGGGPAGACQFWARTMLMASRSASGSVVTLIGFPALPVATVIGVSVLLPLPTT